MAARMPDNQPAPVLAPADLRVHREALLRLNVEYVSWVAAGIEERFRIDALALVGMPVPEYVRSVLDKVCGEKPPSGAFYVASVGDELVGMGGLRRLAPGIAEVKRLYVRPTLRGRRLGESLLARLLGDARAFGYSTVRLDTAPFMTAAHRLYERFGFLDRGPYEGVEVPSVVHSGWRFMELAL